MRPTGLAPIVQHYLAFAIDAGKGTGVGGRGRGIEFATDRDLADRSVGWLMNYCCGCRIDFAANRRAPRAVSDSEFFTTVLCRESNGVVRFGGVFRNVIDVDPYISSLVNEELLITRSSGCVVVQDVNAGYIPPFVLVIRLLGILRVFCESVVRPYFEGTSRHDDGLVVAAREGLNRALTQNIDSRQQRRHHEPCHEKRILHVLPPDQNDSSLRHNHPLYSRGSNRSRASASGLAKGNCLLSLTTISEKTTLRKDISLGEVFYIPLDVPSLAVALQIGLLQENPKSGEAGGGVPCRPSRMDRIAVAPIGARQDAPATPNRFVSSSRMEGIPSPPALFFPPRE